MKLLFKLIILAIALASPNLHAESKKIIKWVDKNGVTQYGDRAPMPNKASKSSVLNKQGVIVQRIEAKKKTKEQDKASAEQARYDNALMASYNSVDEIEISRKRNTKTDALALISLEKKHENLNVKLEKNNEALLKLSKKDGPAAADTVATIEQNTADIAKVEKRITQKKETIKKINQRYKKDKLRYIELASRK
ncbi:MAG: DUF4124 domain-containing protein [Methylophilaceae bacterium]